MDGAARADHRRGSLDPTIERAPTAGMNRNASLSCFDRRTAKASRPIRQAMGSIESLGWDAGILGVAVVVAASVSVTATSLLEGSLLVTTLSGALAASVTLWGLRAVAPLSRWGEHPPAVQRWTEAAGVAAVCVGSGLTVLYLGFHAWILVTGPAGLQTVGEATLQQPTSFFDLITQWDAGWYKGIIEDGYLREPLAGGAANWAFFPLYPLLVRGVSSLTGLSTDPAGVATSVALLTVASAFAYRYLTRTRSRQVALVGVALLTLGPYSFYNYTLYSEPLFVCLVAVGLWALATDRIVTASVMGGLLSATRGVGVLFGVVILLHLVLHTDAFDSIRSAFNSDGGSLPHAFLATLRDRRVLSLAVVPIGLLSYMAYLWVHVGNPLAFVTVQSAWNRSFGNPAGRLIEALQGNTGGPVGPFLGVIGLGALILGGDLLWRGRWVEGVFGLLLVIVPLASGINSIPRYAFGTVVLVFALADRLSRTVMGRTVGLAALAATNIWLLALWFSRHSIVD